MAKTENSFIDTDIINKIGGFKTENLLARILNSFEYNLYIHEYVVGEELILPGPAKNQLEDMISSKDIVIVSESELSNQEQIDYELTLNVLAKELNVCLRKPRDRNLGEIKSMSMAFVKNYGFFISDDHDGKVAAKKHLQNMDGSWLKTIRMSDIILHIRNHEEIGITRKLAKQLYLYGTSPKLGSSRAEKEKIERFHKKLQKQFDDELWPNT